MHTGLVWCFAAALAFAALCLGVALLALATKAQAQRALEKAGLDRAELSRRLGRCYRRDEAQRVALAAARAEVEALRKGRAA